MSSEVLGLVLAGGKSSRMGKDKGSISWHGKPQKYFLADLLSRYCSKVFISCRPSQVKNITPGYSVITDMESFSDSFGAIISALSKYPDNAFLIIACDMPFVGGKALEYLIEQRDSNKIATAYYNSANFLPEPMLAIWEPKSLARLKELSLQGVNCPRKALIKSSSSVKLIRPLDAREITNVNTPLEAARAREVISEI